MDPASDPSSPAAAFPQEVDFFLILCDHVLCLCKSDLHKANYTNPRAERIFL